MRDDQARMNRDSSMVCGEEGFVLVAALSCLVVLSFIGIAAMNTANVERQIAHNINLAEKTFYRTDGATEVGIEMLEWNVACPLGFTGRGIDDDDPDDFYRIQGVQVMDSSFAHRESFDQIPWDPSLPVDMRNVPSDGARSMRLASEFEVPAVDDSVPHSNLAIFGGTGFSNSAGNINMGEAYHGLGKSSATGGTVIDYQIWAQTIGLNNAEAVIRLGYTHLIGQMGECRPY